MASSKSYINIANKYDRVIVLVDMDCFYCQVEEKLNPSLVGKPIAVVQYNAWRGGGIIAVNYPARAKGVTRHMRGDEAKEQCPEIELVRVPNVREKADLTKYREAGKEVAAVLQTFSPLLERASVDEAYLDITEQVVSRLNVMDKGGFQLKPSELVNTFAVGYDSIGTYIQEISSRIEDNTDDFDCEEVELNAVRKSDLKLLIGASIVSEIRVKVKEKTGYECSAGIAHNKILAKLACGINKPNKQTILPLRQVKLLFSTLPVGKIKGLGGKFGEDVCEKLRIKFLGDLLSFSENELQRKFDEKSGSWLYLIARGIDLEAVTPRFYSKSIGCCKKFPGRTAITGLNTLNHWFSELANEICDRLERDIVENNRRAKQMVVSFIQEINGEDVSSSRSANLVTYDPEAMMKLAFDTLRKNTDQFLKPNSENILNNPIKFLGISVGKFETLKTNKNTLQKMFLNQAKKKSETPSNTAAILNTSPQSDIIQGEETNPVPISPTLPQCDIPNNASTRTDPKEIQNPIQKSFFAAHLKKKNDTLERNELNNEGAALVQNEKKENTKPIKSFFLNAIKRKSADKNVESPCKSDEFSLKVSDDEITDDLSHINFEENVQNQHEINTNKHSLNNSDEDSNFHNRPGTSYQQKQSNLSSTTDFTRSYAEYFVPEPNPDDYVTCEKCGKSILSYAMQTHMDFHFAVELSQEQRQQFRNEIKAKITSPPVKKQKPNMAANNNNKSKNSAGTAIEKFLVKISPSNSESVLDVCVDDKQRCIECGLMVHTSKMLEHMDYHTARKLQLELNNTKLCPNNVTPPSIKKSSKKNSKVDSNKSIKAFFVPKA